MAVTVRTITQPGKTRTVAKAAKSPKKICKTCDSKRCIGRCRF